ncbi:uncharacterized protein LOC110686855 isoform X2 [Chenopodium quinoa]|uniref:uncharacterized protein LOC110686855 isoform X2 n=1 Tax=Chenopodium quinoa TaxID=63459 RepID=UPI000B7737E4|nr:uncharacterized protein LOC110686855 isoform X2 [Chenopodium quinoa]
MAEAPYNFKRPSAQGRQSKQAISVSLPQNSISEEEQPRPKKARARPSIYITAGKKPKSTKAKPSSAQSSEQLEKAPKKRSKATKATPSCAQSSEQLEKAPKKRSKATKATPSSGQSSKQLKNLAKGKNKASLSAPAQTSKQLRDAAKNQRVYNAPTSDEVAVIWPDSVSSSQSSWPHILVTGKSTEIHRIAHYYGCYDPLQYPLLFPRGECGWHQGLKKVLHDRDRQLATEPDPIQSCAVQTPAEFLDAEATRASRRHTRADKYISTREYYTYMIQIRIGNMLLRAGRAFLQYIVDMYIKVENTRLDFFRRNQDTIRADLYKGILDTVESGETNAANVGHKFILPPSFLGGPRDMKRRYLNAMALVQKYGKPDLFVTVTCNANWPEIKAELSPGEAAQDRPDLVARIFRAKLIALRKKVMKEKIFGKVAAMIYVVEFQKRGLPHAHFLLILQPQYKMKCPADYDKFVCAEIPPVNQPELRKIVLQHMMHGPCGKLNPECPCMRKKDNVSSCKNGYPKQFTPQTTTNKDGYPCYRRTDTGEQVKVRGAYLDNRWVVPYNPYLSSLFDCHLNVEVCSTIKAVKYLYKYVYKGHDRVAFNVSVEDRNSEDEIAQYQSGRWVSPCEAAWRIFGFDLFEIYPPVMPLSVHMPEMNTVCVAT